MVMLRYAIICFIFLLIICSINKHLLIGPDAYPLESINCILQWFAGRRVAKHMARGNIILHDLREVTLERQVYCSITIHVHLNVSQQLYFIKYNNLHRIYPFLLHG